MSDQVIPHIVLDVPSPPPVAPAPAAAPAPVAPAARPKLVYTVDALGRRIGVRKMSMAQRYNFVGSLPVEVASNPALSQMQMVAWACASINGVEINEPTSDLHIKHTLQQLDDEGFIAVADAIREHFAPLTNDQAKN